MDTVRVVTLVLATLSTGMAAGVFYGFSISTLITMRGVDDRTYVDLNRRINRDIQNGRFFLVFLGSVLFDVLAVVLLLGGDHGSALLPAVIGLALYLVAFAITVGGNLPLVYQLDRAGPAADPAAARHRYEGPWTRMHTIRTVFHVAAFGALCWALASWAG
jgi:uncharacterized membrane protein